jgi:hypothetical protein
MLGRVKLSQIGMKLGNRLLFSELQLEWFIFTVINVSDMSRMMDDNRDQQLKV